MSSIALSALLVSGIGAFVAAFLLTVIWKALPPELLKYVSIRNLQANAKKEKLRSLDNKLEQAFSESINANSKAALKQLLIAAFENPALEQPFTDVDEIYQTHLGVLAKLVTAADKRSISLTQLPVLEDLVHHRNVLLTAHREVRISMRNIKSRRSAKGKEFSSWAENEYQTKLKTAFEAVEVNRLSILSQLDEIIEELAKGDEAREVTYH